MKTRVTELLGIEAPIIQGAMARIADGNLAGAVSASASSPAAALRSIGSSSRCARHAR